MQFLAEYGLFLIKAITIVLAVLASVLGVIAISSKAKQGASGHLSIKKLNEKYAEAKTQLNEAILSKDEYKQSLKAAKKQAADDKKKQKSRLFVLHFKGDIKAQAVASLREEITAILTISKPDDEIVIHIESTGGMVHAYGLAASQLQRIKDNNLKLTATVDKVAASGGYLMACVADKILAAPFAVIGSIGVIAQLPNFNRFLNKHDVDFELMTAGDYKRTLTLFGKNTDEGRGKFQEQLEDTHTLFKEFVQEHRSQLDIATVATGEHWYGKQALDLKLVDTLQTSDDYLLTASKEADIYEIEYKTKKKLTDKISGSMQSIIKRVKESLGKDNEDILI